MSRKPKYQFICKECGLLFWPNSGPQKTCSDCKAKLEASRMAARKQIPEYYEQECDECGQLYTPTSGNQKRCTVCSMDHLYRKNLAEKEYTALFGVGIGRGQGRGPEHHSWINGQYGYINRKLDSVEVFECELCRKDLSSVVKAKSGHGKWAVHHVDGNDLNNEDLSNLQLLCVKCHNNIHKNWLFTARCKGIVQQ